MYNFDYIAFGIVEAIQKTDIWRGNVQIELQSDTNDLPTLFYTFP